MTPPNLALLETSSPSVTSEVLALTERRGPPWNLALLEEFEFVYEDGVPMESLGHRWQMELFTDVVRQAMLARGRTDYFMGGNMFVYYTPEQARFVANHEPMEYKPFVGPDFFFVDNAPHRERQVWKVWEEGDRYPDIIIELLSPSTARIDKGIKKRRYAEVFATGEYYLYAPGSDEFTAYHLSGKRYREVSPDRQGCVHSPTLGLRLGLWRGEFRAMDTTWLRLYDDQGRLIPTGEERADAAEKRADAAEAEIARLRALLNRADNS